MDSELERLDHKRSFCPRGIGWNPLSVRPCTRGVAARCSSALAAVAACGLACPAFAAEVHPNLIIPADGSPLLCPSPRFFAVRRRLCVALCGAALLRLACVCYACILVHSSPACRACAGVRARALASRPESCSDDSIPSSTGSSPTFVLVSFIFSFASAPPALLLQRANKSTGQTQTGAMYSV